MVRLTAITVSFAAALVLVLSAATAAERVRVAGAHGKIWDSGIVLGVAEDQGFFKAQNLDVEIMFVRAGPEGVQQVLTRESDVAQAMGILSAIGAYGKGAPIRIIAAEKTGSDHYWYVRADSPIKGVADFDGKTIGHNKAGSSAHIMTMALKEHTGRKLKLVMAGRMPDNLTQVLSGQLDIGYGGPPYALNKMKTGELRLVFRGLDIAPANNQTIRVTLTHSDTLKKRRPALIGFMKAYGKAVDWMYENKAAMVKIYAKTWKLTPDLAEKAISFYPKQGLAFAPVRGIDRTMKQAVDFGFVTKPLSKSQINEMIDIVHDPAKG